MNLVACNLLRVYLARMKTANTLPASPSAVSLAPARVTRDELQKVLELIADGSNHKQAAATIGLTASQLHAEIQRDAGTRAAYALARKARGAMHAAKVTELATDVLRNNADAKRTKVAMDGHMWAAGRYDPAAWGDRQIIQHEEAPAAVSADELKAALIALAQLAMSQGVPLVAGAAPGESGLLIEGERDLATEILGS